MAIIRPSQYPGRWNPVSADAPQGSGKNRTAPGSNDGSYFDQVWFDDSDSLNQALFIASGVSPNGTQDIGTSSQLFDALINNRWSSIGNYFVGTIVTASDGLQYYCVSSNGRDSSVIDPSTVSDRNTWVKFPYEEGVNSNGTFRIHYDGTIECWGLTDESGVDGKNTATFAAPFTTTTDLYIQVTERTSSTSPINSVSACGVIIETITTTSCEIWHRRGNGDPSSLEVSYYYARGK